MSEPAPFTPFLRLVLALRGDRTSTGSTYANDKPKRLIPFYRHTHGRNKWEEHTIRARAVGEQSTRQAPLLENTLPSSSLTELPHVPTSFEHAHPHSTAFRVAIDISAQGADTPSHFVCGTSPTPLTMGQLPLHPPSPLSSSFKSHLRVGSNGLGAGRMGRPAWTATLSLHNLPRPERWSRSAIPTPGTSRRITPGWTGTTAGTVASEAGCGKR